MQLVKRFLKSGYVAATMAWLVVTIVAAALALLAVTSPSQVSFDHVRTVLLWLGIAIVLTVVSFRRSRR